MAQQVQKKWIRLKGHNFCLNDLLTKSNRSEIQTFKVEERTFGTPCSCLIVHQNTKWQHYFSTGSTDLLQVAFCTDSSFIATFKLLAYLKFCIKSGNTGGQYTGVMAAQVAHFGPNLD